MIGSNAMVEIFKHNQSYGLLNSMLSGLADIDFDNIAVTYTSLTDVFVLKKSTSVVKTITITYSTAARDIVSTAVMT